MAKFNLELTKDLKKERPYGVNLNNAWDQDRDLMVSWCNEQFGPRNEKYNNPRWEAEGRWVITGFRFKNERDATWFMMRWS